MFKLENLIGLSPMMKATQPMYFANNLDVYDFSCFQLHSHGANSNGAGKGKLKMKGCNPEVSCNVNAYNTAMGIHYAKNLGIGKKLKF